MDFAGLYNIDHKKKKNKGLVFFNRYILPFVLIFTGTFAAQWILRELLVFPVTVNTESMHPALKSGKRVFLIYPHLTGMHINDIVYVKKNNITLLCRITAKEGDIMKILNKSLYTNNTLFKNYFSTSLDKTEFPGDITVRDNTDEFLIGPGKYFCLNDNWDNFQDSRTWGPISYSEIKGKVIYNIFLGFKITSN